MREVLDVPSTDDEPLGSVLRALRLRRTGPDDFTGTSLPQLTGRIYGGQVLAQSVLAAAETLPIDTDDGPRQLHSVHGYFLRPGKVEDPISFVVERLHDGRSFSTRRTHAIQHGKPILSLISSYQEAQPGREHASAMPEVPSPEDLPSALDMFGAMDHPVAKFLSSTAAFDIRHVDPDIYLRPAAEPTDRQMLWMRARSPLPQGLSQLHHRALLAYSCDQVLLEPVLRRHAISFRTAGLSMASLDHGMWWHRPVDVGSWLLYVQESPSAQGGRGLGLAKVFDRGGTHVATIAQEGMVRVPDDAGEDTAGAGERGEEWRRPSLR